MNNGLALADYLIVAGFFVIMLGIGIRFAGRMKNLKDFFCGGNRVPWWVSGVSLYMTTFSAFTFVSYSALAYGNGLVCITIWWMTVPCAFLSARFLAARWRRTASASPVEFVERRYGPFLRQGFAWAGVPLIVFDDALKLFVIGKMVTVSLGMEGQHAMPIAIAVCGTIMLTYTLMGGLWAVMITDFVQFIVMATAVIVLVPLVLVRAGGLGPILSGAPDNYWRPVSADYGLAWLVPFFFIMLLTYATKWPIVQRYYAVETDSQARKVGYTLGVLTFVGTPLLFFPAFAARVFMPGIEDGNAVYPLVCKELLPVGLMGMVIAGMFSATMSMLSSDYNAVASVLTNDIYKRLFAPNASDRATVFAGRLATLAVGLAAVGIGLALARAEGLADLVKVMAGVFSFLLPPVALPMIGGLLTRKVSSRGALAGFVAGTVIGATAYGLSFSDGIAVPEGLRRWLFLAPDYAGGLAFLRTVPYLTWITSVPTLGAMAVFSTLWPDPEAARNRVSRFLSGLEERAPDAADGGAVGAETLAAVQIIGAATAALGGLLALAVLATAPGRLSAGVGVVLLGVGLAVWCWARKRLAGTS